MHAKVHTLNQVIQEKIGSLCLKQTSDVSLQDDFGLYVPPSATHTRFSNTTFDLRGAVTDFIDGEKRVFLILGDSGSGKSFFGQTLIKRKSEEYQFGERIPLFISLPSLRNPKTNLMQETLFTNGFTQEEIEQLCKTQKFLLFLDAYDEINGFDNLYTTNKLEGWDTKIIMTCRTDYLTLDSNYHCYFTPFVHLKPMENVFQEIFIAPFVRGQIERYIIQYLSVKRHDLLSDILLRPELSKQWLFPKTYEYWIENIPGLKDLSCQPFLLRITMEVLPEVIVEMQASPDKQDNFKMTSAKLYDYFVSQWFARQKNKLSSKLIGLGEFVSPTFEKECIDFSKALAKKMHDKKTDIVYYEDASSSYSDEDESTKISQKEMAQWAVFFSEELVPQDKNNDTRRQNRIRIRNASLLKKIGANQWAFSHPSLRDYFLSLNIIGAQSKPHLNIEKGSPMIEPVSPRPGQSVIERFRSLNRRSPRGISHRMVGSFFILNRFDRKEAEELWLEERMHIAFEPDSDRQKVVLGQGSFGKLRIGQHSISHRFSGVKKIRGEKNIKGSVSEAEFQRELNGLPNVMPIWDSQIIKSKRTKEDVLLQFMPLAGFGNGEKLVSLLCYIENFELKQKLLIHILKCLLTGIKGLHSRRVYHLDFKPANFVMDSLGGVYIIDFGCAYREYGNKADALITGGKGDYDYFSPDRMLNKRTHPIIKFGPSDNHELGGCYDGEKADIWAVGISLLKLYLEDLKFISGSDKSAHWIIENLTAEYFIHCFEKVPGWIEEEENSFMGCLKTLLQIDPNHRLPAAEALKNPLFSNPHQQLSPPELQQLMSQLTEWKINPPHPAHVTTLSPGKFN